MKRTDVLAWLRSHGVTLKEGGKHTKASKGKRQSTIPRHTEIDNDLCKAIGKQLGIGKPPSK